MPTGHLPLQLLVATAPSWLLKPLQHPHLLQPLLLHPRHALLLQPLLHQPQLPPPK